MPIPLVCSPRALPSHLLFAAPVDVAGYGSVWGPELVRLFDEAKAMKFYKATPGWNDADVRARVFTPIEPSQILGTAFDPYSIMCCQIPGTITKNGKPIVDGLDIDAKDHAFAASIGPKSPAAKMPAPKAARPRRAALRPGAT